MPRKLPAFLGGKGTSKKAPPPKASPAAARPAAASARGNAAATGGVGELKLPADLLCTDEMMMGKSATQSFERANKMKLSKKNHLSDVQSTAPNQYTARIEGSAGASYLVSLGVAESRISTAECECPDQREGWCKHILLVLLELRPPQPGEPALPAAKPESATPARQQQPAVQQPRSSAAGVVRLTPDGLRAWATEVVKHAESYLEMPPPPKQESDSKSSKLKKRKASESAAKKPKPGPRVKPAATVPVPCGPVPGFDNTPPVMMSTMDYQALLGTAKVAPKDSPATSQAKASPMPAGAAPAADVDPASPDSDDSSDNELDRILCSGKQQMAASRSRGEAAPRHSPIKVATFTGELSQGKQKVSLDDL